jgi:putative endonuclease
MIQREMNPCVRRFKLVWYMYVVMCSDNTLYTGITKDVDRRVNEHNASSKGARYTKGRRPVTLVYVIAYNNSSEALKAEYRFKQLSRKQKLEWITK